MVKRVKSRIPRVALDCLGCKLNQAEIELLARQLAGAGYEIVPAGEDADIYVLNTCTVTHVADRKSRHSLRQARRRNPGVRLVAIGCYAERAPHELERIEGVELVVGNAQKLNLVELLGKADPTSAPGITFQPDIGRRTRAFIKVQDGCHSFCAYCIVPLVRSREACVPVERVVADVAAYTTAGYREVVLTGTEIGGYNCDNAGLKTLLERILTATHISRLRLSSLQPQHITRELIGLWDDARLCPHFHLSLQSGSDALLSRMQRRYNTEGYRRAVNMIREALPDAAVTTDVIVGFPGETEAEFRESYRFSREMHFARIHVFPYSPRPGTAAAKMPQDVPDTVKKARGREMLALAGENSVEFNRGFLGRKMEVLWERKVGGVWSGLTGNYIKVYAKSKVNLANELLPARLVELYRDGVRGELDNP